jgi:glutamyl-tRNA(Gln) amidotransferase subunit D
VFKPELEGYHGEILHLLKKSGARVGSVMKITSKTGEVFEGVLIPRSEYDDHSHICLKMNNGYNIGIHLNRTEKVEVLGEGEKPHFSRPPPAAKRGGLPRVTVISTGGTIASRVDYRTGAVQPELSAEDLTSVVPELASLAEIDAHILYTELSENLTATHWTGMAEEVAKRITQGSEGVVISHGTDTMHYTSAALSFALQNLPVPVLIVGAQRSSDRPSSDAASNLTGAVGLATMADMASVGIAMHENLSDRYVVAHRGTRVRKCHTSRRDTFKSINSPPLARYDLSTNEAEVLGRVPGRDKKRRLELKARFDHRAYLLKFYPGFDPHLIDSVLDLGARGIILEGTGLGHVSKHCYEPIRKALKQEVPVFMTSQTIWGRVDMNVYSTGRDLVKIGVTPLEDMLAETALVKLMWVLAETKSEEKVRGAMLTSVAGEVADRTLTEAA